MKRVLILSLLLLQPAIAKDAKKEKLNCERLQKQYYSAVKQKSPTRHKLAETLWVKCGV
jgi:hypothetical protein